MPRTRTKTPEIGTGGESGRLRHRVAADLRTIAGGESYTRKAKASDVDTGYLWRILNGARNLTLDTLERIANGLGFNVLVSFVPKDKRPKT